MSWRTLLYLVVNATRLPICLLTAMLVVASYHLVAQPVNHFVVVVVFAITVATMLINDYVDRERDASDGKPFVVTHQRVFFAYMATWWLVTAVLIASLATKDVRSGALAMLMATLGCGYSWTRRIPMLPVSVVGATTALSTVFPLFHHVSTDLVLLSLSVFFGIASREVKKDLEDEAVDVETGWKWTLPSAFGAQTAQAVLRALAAISMLLLYAVPLTARPETAYWAGVTCICLTAISGLMLRRVSASKAVADLGMALFLGTMSFAYVWLRRQPEVQWVLVPAAALVLVTLALCTDESGIVRSGCKRLVRWLNEQCLEAGQMPYQYGPRRSAHWKATWTTMYLLLLATIVLCRWAVGSRSQHLGGRIWFEGIGTIANPLYDGIWLALVTGGFFSLLLLLNMPQHYRAGRELVNHLTVGLCIGIAAATLDLYGVPLALTSVLIPMLATRFSYNGPFCHVLKRHGTQTGIIIASGILLGTGYAVVSYLVAKLVATAYHWWFMARQHRAKPLANWLALHLRSVGLV